MRSGVDPFDRVVRCSRLVFPFVDDQLAVKVESDAVVRSNGFLSLSAGSRWREWGNGKTLERIKQMASGELRIELAEALHWLFQRFCE